MTYKTEKILNCFELDKDYFLMFHSSFALTREHSKRINQTFNQHVKNTLQHPSGLHLSSQVFESMAGK